MIWQWLFAILYSVTSGMVFFIAKQNSKSKFFVIPLAIILSSGAFFLLYNYFGAFAVMMSILVFRTVVFIWQCALKNAVAVINNTLICASIDVCIMPFLTLKIPWEYVIVAYLTSFCLIYLTPYFKNRIIIMDWISTSITKSKWFPILLPIIPLFSSVLVFILMREKGTISVIITAILSLLFSMTIIVLQEFILQTVRISELNNAMEKWQTGAKEYMNTIRAQRHDFNIHLHAISGLIAGNDFEKCSDYVKKLVDQADDVNELMPIYDSVIGSMMADMRKKARNKGTDVHYDIKYSMKNIVCSAYECNQIIGNLISNAIDAIFTEAEKKYGVAVSVTKRNGSSVIMVENMCEKEPDELENIFNLGYTTKKGHEGIGLAMVKKTLARYSGKIYAKIDDRIIRFIVHIPNKITEE